MQQEAAHELLGAESRGLVARARLGTVVLPTEGDAALIVSDEAAVGDGDAAGIAREVG